MIPPSVLLQEVEAKLPERGVCVWSPTGQMGVGVGKIILAEAAAGLCTVTG